MVYPKGNTNVPKKTCKDVLQDIDHEPVRCIMDTNTKSFTSSPQELHHILVSQYAQPTFNVANDHRLDEEERMEADLNILIGYNQSTEISPPFQGTLILCLNSPQR